MIKFHRAQCIADGIRIFPTTPEDFRKLTYLLNSDNIPYQGVSATGKLGARPKCAEEHLSNGCTKSRETKATCANCGESHPASYKGYTSYPKLAQKTKETKPAHQQLPRSYAQVSRETVPTNDLAAHLQKFSEMFQQMQQIANQIQTVFHSATPISQADQNV
ncbi:unnamed protein product [Brassicogethes aeneus]|uniref:Uncharacterized protein n=1 Tax=Brassicogethes aeneus TaxID=1431903 RepID=A0A9P0ASQ4_BRAAE|nr:unnamed protein product [Brassicogethes aeneus]